MPRAARPSTIGCCRTSCPRQSLRSVMPGRESGQRASARPGGRAGGHTGRSRLRARPAQPGRGSGQADAGRARTAPPVAVAGARAPRCRHHGTAAAPLTDSSNLPGEIRIMPQATVGIRLPAGNGPPARGFPGSHGPCPNGYRATVAKSLTGRDGRKAAIRTGQPATRYGTRRSPTMRRTPSGGARR
jgi:hypothetical protein